MLRVVEIQTPGTLLSVERGHLIVQQKDKDKIRVALDDIGVLLLSTAACSLSTAVIERLAERSAQIVFCGSNFVPTAAMLPYASTNLLGKRLELQLSASRPLQKNLWAEIVRAKVLEQAALLENKQGSGAELMKLIPKIRSGDTSNIEAQAAKIYWPLLFGVDFRRKQVSDQGVNILLNYGYTVLRASVLRAITVSGLTAYISLKHSSKENVFALADDLMEPFRPLIDQIVYDLNAIGINYLCSESKQQLCSILTIDIYFSRQLTTLPNVLNQFCRGLIESFESGEVRLPTLGLIAGL